MLTYIIQTIVFQLLFLIIYEAFLKRETFFNWNRAYLLITPILALIIPFIRIPELQGVVFRDFVIKLPEVFIGNVPNTNKISTYLVLNEQNSLTLFSWELAFYTGMFLMIVLFVFKLVKLWVMLYRNPKFKRGNLTIVRLLGSVAAFSFFNFIFLGEQINKKEKEAILKHEIIHVKQKHSLDLLYFEILKIILWFNPFIYIFQSRIQTLHEYIADAEVTKHENKKQYYQNLLAKVFETNNMSFINSFFKTSLLKKRIIMLQKSKSKQIRLFKYSLLIPVIIGMLIYSSCSKDREEISVNRELNDEELIEKFVYEYKKMKANGADNQVISQAFISRNKKYLMTREEFYREITYFNEAFKKDKNVIVRTQFSDKTYDEYLKWKKTNEAKEIWENNTYDGVLKLVVGDMNNLTALEKEKRDKKMQLLYKDDHYIKFIQTNGKSTITLGETEPKVRNKHEESKFVQTVDVPFGVIEEVPVFPECDSGTKEERKKCTSQAIAKFVNSNFNTKLATDLGLKGRQRINVIFKISLEGEITNVRVRAPHPELEKETKRVIMTLPKFVPGTHKGEAVNVLYSLPIIFQVAY